MAGPLLQLMRRPLPISSMHENTQLSETYHNPTKLEKKKNTFCYHVHVPLPTKITYWIYMQPSFKAGLHVLYDASTSISHVWTGMTSSRFTRGLCLHLCLCLRRTCKPAFSVLPGMQILPIACLSSGSYSTSRPGIYFLISAASSSGVKLMAARLYVRDLSFSCGASSNSTVDLKQSGM